jgi:hypothetical protein
VHKEALALIDVAERDSLSRQKLFDRYATTCNLPRTALLLWDGCVRQRTKYCWPEGFRAKWDAHKKAHRYRGLLAAMGNGPPRTAFVVAGGLYVKGYDLAHLYDVLLCDVMAL